MDVKNDKDVTTHQVTDEEGTRIRRFSNLSSARLLAIVGIVMSLVHLYLNFFRVVPPLSQYAIHWCFGMGLIFALYPGWRRSPRDRVHILDVFLQVLTLTVTIHIVRDPDALMWRAVTSSATLLDLVLGTVAILLSLEAGRRTIGMGLPMVAILLLLYARVGALLPAAIGNKGYSFDRIVSYLFSTEGIFSTPLAMSATQVFLLVLFGAFISVSGAGDFIMDLANSVAGTKKGGPAKVAVMSSALFGSISGSAVANVISTGTFTIPTMKKAGYSPRFAGAVEAVASTGGQIMPPVMGAGAFVMAELLGRPYLDIMLAATIPAILYYFSVFFVVHLEAERLNLRGMSRENVRPVIQVIADRGHLFVPLVVLIFVLAVQRQSVMKAAIWAIVTTVIVSAIKSSTRMDLRKVLRALEQGAINSLTVISATACAGIAIGAVMLTGLGMKLTIFISQLSGNDMLLALLFAALTATMLGMGLPTIAAYIISASVLGAGLIGLGIDPLAAHMFLFYYSILAMITPPVALAAYAAGNLAGANIHQVGFLAMRLGAVAYIVPFMFVYGPSLLLIGSAGEIVLAFISAMIGVSALSIAQQGWFMGETVKGYLRVILAAASLALIKPGVVTDMIGLALIAVTLLLQPSIRKKMLRRIIVSS